jgi:hypothetical protein
MARSYARIMTAIWKNAEFRKLHAGAQRVYVLLVTQDNISAAGTLPLTVRRWAEMAADTSIPDINRDLAELAAGRFIAVDHATEEVLVRSFVRWDGGYGNSKRKHSIRDAAEAVASIPLRSMLAAEFERLGLPFGSLVTAPDAPPDTEPDALSDQDGDHLSDLSGSPPSSQVDSASGAAPGGAPRFDRVVVTQVGSTGTSTHNPQPIPPSAGATGAQQLVAEWIDLCRRRPPTRVIGHMSKQIKALLEDGIDPDDIRSGIELWMTKDVSPAVLPSVVNSVMNQQSRASPNGVSPTDAAITAFAARHMPSSNLLALPGGAS